MPRPKLTEETTERITAAVDARTKVPAHHLTTDEQIAFVLDALDDAETRVSRLQSRVKDLEAELERARSEPDDTDRDSPGLDEIASADLPNGLGRGPR